MKYSLILYSFVVMDINWLKAATYGDKIVMNMDSQGKVFILQLQWWWLWYNFYSNYWQFFFSEIVRTAYVVRYTGFQIDMANFQSWYSFYCHSTDEICRMSWQLICCVLKMSFIMYQHWIQDWCIYEQHLLPCSEGVMFESICSFVVHL